MARPFKHETPESRFWKKVQITPGCWLWTGALDGDGKSRYGHIRVGGKRIGAHRFSYELHKGKLPDGLFACHSCDVTQCVNPDHLFAGTNLENIADSTAKKRRAVQRGDQNHNSRLGAGDVEKIRSLLREGAQQQMIADRFGVCCATINHIHTGRTWE